jgi:hypothetical protein
MPISVMQRLRAMNVLLRLRHPQANSLRGARPAKRNGNKVQFETNQRQSEA